LKNEELTAIILAINDDIQKTFSRYTDLTSNRMPEDYTSVFEVAPRSAKTLQPAQEKQAPPRQPQHTPQQVPPSQPLVQPTVQTVLQQVTQQVVQRQVQPQQVPSAPNNVFGLFNNAEERKVPEPPIHTPLVQQEVPVPQQAAPTPPKDDAITKLNEIMHKMQLKEEEDQKQREEEAKRKAAMQSQFATSYAPFGMNPYIGQMNMCYPYMTNMQRPVAPNAAPYQVYLLLTLRY
jgi:hypothetical protein